MFSDYSLRIIPLVALSKLMTLHWRTTDNFKLEIFGFVVSKDITDEHRLMMTVKSCMRDIHAQRARKDFLKIPSTMNELDSIFLGILRETRMLVSPLLLDPQEVVDLHGKLREFYYDYGDMADVSLLMSVLKNRSCEHACSLHKIMEAQVRPNFRK